MDDAFDTLRNQRVRAREAGASAFPGRYICPVCQTEVLRASGLLVATHFRHHPGTDHEECERYCGRFYRDVPLARHESEHIDAVLVAHAPVSEPNCCVSFSVRYRAHSAVESVDFVAGPASTHYKIHHSRREQYFAVRRPEKHYLIKAQLDCSAHENHIVEGFDRNAVVFPRSDGASVRLAAHRVLRPGAYIVVSRHAIEARLHPLLQATPLKTLEGLQATSIEIPEDPSWKIRENIRNLLGFETTSTLTWYAFLEPEIITELAADSWEISNTDTIACYIRFSEHLSRPLQLLIQERQRGRVAVKYFPVNGQSSEVVITATATATAPELYRIGISQDGEPRFVCEIRRSSDSVEPECARLAFQFLTKSRRIRVFWSSHDLPGLLKALRQGQAQLERIDIPPSVQIIAGDSAGKRARIVGVAAVDGLTTFLKNARFPCVLRARGYPPIALTRGRPLTSVTPRLAEDRAAAAPFRSNRRFADAFMRDRVSAYAAGLIR